MNSNLDDFITREEVDTFLHVDRPVMNKHDSLHYSCLLIAQESVRMMLEKEFGKDATQYPRGRVLEIVAQFVELSADGYRDILNYLNRNGIA